MRFNLSSIDCDNAAFEEEPASELARCLRAVADAVADGDTSGSVRDINGNTVGSWAVS